jgi:hypothetical protein
VSTPESDEVAAHQFRLAQANRLRRFCAANSLDTEDVMAGRITVDLTSICGPDGRIQPEPIDFHGVR